MVARLQFRNGNFLFLAVFYQESRGGLQMHQILQGFGCTVLGTAFHQLAQEDKSNNHPGGLEIDIVRPVFKGKRCQAEDE